MRPSLDRSSALFVLILLGLLFGCQKLDRGAKDEASAVAQRYADAKGEEPGFAEETESMAQDKSKSSEEGKDDKDGPHGWKRAVLDTHKIRVAVGDDETLPVDALAIHARVDGFRARVLLDVDFHNPEASTLEANFSVRLPEGASLYYLAFGGRVEAAKLPPQPGAKQDKGADEAMSLTPEAIRAAREQIWSDPAQLKEAVMVERDQAKVAYRNTVRRNVDPALSEWAGSGVFNTRLFPIQPGAVHRVVLGYDVDLLEVADGLSLPLIVPEDATTRSLDLLVVPGEGLDASLVRVDAEPEPEAETEAKTEAIAASASTKGQLRYRLEAPPAQLELNLRGPTTAALTGSEAATGAYFAARVTPELPRQEASAGARRAVFAVDVSMSSNPEKFNVWLDVLRATLELDREGIQEFAVLLFNVEQFWWTPGFTANGPEQVEALSAFMQTLALEGATDLGAALAEATRPSWAAATLGPDAAPDWDLFLLSDGAATWGEADAERVLRRLRADFGGRVFAYRTGLSGTALPVLDRLAAETGGAVFAVTGPDQVAAAATAHRVTPWELLSISADGVEDLLVAGAPRFLYPGQVLTVAGRLREDGGGVSAVDLRVAQAGLERDVKLKLPRAVRSELAPRVYGQLAATALERFHGLGAAPEPNGEPPGQEPPGQEPAKIESLAYARHFRVTGRAASLLMLDSAEDYQRAGLDPLQQAKRDAAIVAATSVGPQLARAERLLASQLGDPRAAMLATLDRVRALASPDTPIDASSQASALAALEAVIRQLPDASFEVEIPKLACARHDREVLDAKLRAALEARELIYDELVAAAELRRQQVGPADGLKALSSLVEANPGDTVMARDVAFTAREWGMGAQVYELLRRVAATRPEEPQTYLALGSLAGQVGAPDLAMIYFELALAGGWEQRFGDVHQIAAVEYLRFLGQVDPNELSNAELARSRRAQLAQHLPVRSADLLVIMTWNTDNTDIDLHVLEPSGEDCHYANRSTRAGGQMSVDVTQGFGPEMYYIPRAEAGSYRIQAHYFASDANRLSTRTKAYVTVFEGFGTAQERVSDKLVTLEQGKSTHEIMTIQVK